MRIGETLVQQDGFAETVEVRRAIGTISEVFADFPARTGLEFCIERILKMACDVSARRSMSMDFLHQMPRWIE